MSSALETDATEIGNNNVGQGVFIGRDATFNFYALQLAFISNKQLLSTTSSFYQRYI